MAKKTHVPLSERRQATIGRTPDKHFPDYDKSPRPIHIVWEARNAWAEYEINRLHALFKDKRLKGLAGDNGAVATRQVLATLLAYRNIPIRVLKENIPKELRFTVQNTMANLVGEVYWKVPHGYQMKTDYVNTINPDILIVTTSTKY